MENKRIIEFTIQGEFIDNLAREKLRYDNDITSAYELVKSCLVSDEINENEQIGLACKILDGQYKIKGNSAEGITLEETNDCGHLIECLERMKERLDTLEKENTDLQRDFNNKISCIGESLGRYDMFEVNRKWKYEYEGEEDIFEIPRLNADIISEKMVQDFVEHSQVEQDDDYGWLEPNGTFHSVPWGEHTDFAYHWLKDKDPNYDKKYYDCDAGDRLIERGWVLLHSPAGCSAFVTRDEARPLTKAQREFLYTYYRNRGKREEAERYIEE